LEIKNKMGTFDILNCEIECAGKRILYLEGQVRHYIIEPEFSVLVTGIKCEGDFIPPYKQWDTASFSEFTGKMQKFRSSLEERINSKMKINLEEVEDIVD